MAHAERDTVRHFEEILLAFATQCQPSGLFPQKKTRSGDIVVEKCGTSHFLTA